jgi:hypothetical protein
MHCMVGLRCGKKVLLMRISQANDEAKENGIKLKREGHRSLRTVKDWTRIGDLPALRNRAERFHS